MKPTRPRELPPMRPRDETARRPAAGSVVLVGAGPGDPELLTLKAVRALQSADVILFDALVSDEILDFACREAKRLAVGKRGGRKSCKQSDINDLMVRLARRGKRVVRLKAGDPMIFGRAGEEIAQLEAAGIPVEVVPGITAGLAAAAALGVSLTHRDHAHSVRFVTGHSKNGGLPDGLDWHGLADGETSLVFYMAGRTGAAVASRLIEGGLAGRDAGRRDGVGLAAGRNALGRNAGAARGATGAVRCQPAGPARHWPGLRARAVREAVAGRRDWPAGVVDDRLAPEHIEPTATDAPPP